jgi:hypothetical protein
VPLFQYQQKAEPLLPIAPPPLPPLTWLPTYPDTVPHRRLNLKPSLTFLPLLPPVSFTEVRITQAPLELLFSYGEASPVRVTQAAVEILHQYLITLRQVRVTQVAVEILYPFGCYVFVEPLPAACPVSFEPTPAPQPCADEAPIFP